MQIVLLRNVFGWRSKEPISIRCVMNGLGTRSAYQDSFDTDLLGMPISGRHWSYIKLDAEGMAELCMKRY